MRKPSLAIRFAASLALGATLLGSTAHSQVVSEQLTLDDVQKIIAQAASYAKRKAPAAVIAVVDREGFVLGVWSVEGNTNLASNADPTGPNRVGAAVREAGTASYLSSDQNAFTTRTAQYIIQQNFPPGIRSRPAGPLVGVAFSNLPYSDINRFKRIDVGINGEQPGTPGLSRLPLGDGIPNTRLSGRASSCPLYKNHVLVGGIGAFSGANDTAMDAVRVELNNQVPGKNVDENIALSGQIGYTPDDAIYASNVTIDGIGVPYVAGKGQLKNVQPLSALGAAVTGYSLHASPPQFPFPQEFLGGQNVEVRFPIIGDPLPGTVNGQPRLTEDEVRGIIARASDRARTTRAGIRLPVGVAMQAWLTVVGNPNQAGVPAPVLAIARTPGATFFSFDVALQKARTALFFSDNTRAFSSRTVGFLAQNYYPPGLEGKAPGPFGPAVPTLKKNNTFKKGTFGTQVNFSLLNPDLDNLPNGITIFPGGFPLYRNGVLIGAVGISGDGVDQDDIAGASASGTVFDPPGKIRADQFTYDGARLPYAKFPRNPER